MSTASTLKSLEVILESFLDRAIKLKEQRLGVLDGMNRLDDLVRASRNGSDVSARVTDWISNRRRWLSEEHLRIGDVERIDQMLTQIGAEIKGQDRLSSGQKKVSEIISSWRSGQTGKPAKVTLPRRGETREESEIESIVLFDKILDRSRRIFADMSGGKKHLLSVLDDALKSALLQKNTEALLLSAFMIYYLQQGGYKVSPYTRRLKEAERVLKESRRHV